MEMGGKVGIVKKHFPHGGKGGSKCGLKHLDEIQTLTRTKIFVRAPISKINQKNGKTS